MEKTKVNLQPIVELYNTFADEANTMFIETNEMFAKYPERVSGDIVDDVGYALGRAQVMQLVTARLGALIFHAAQDAGLPIAEIDSLPGDYASEAFGIVPAPPGTL